MKLADKYDWYDDWLTRDLPEDLDELFEVVLAEYGEIMSLEEVIFANTQAVKELTEVLKGMGESLQVIKNNTGFNSLEKDNQSILQELKGLPTEPLITHDTFKACTEVLIKESKKITFDDIKKVTVDLAKLDRDLTLHILKGFGVSKATELKEHQFEEYISIISKHLNK
jgi:hypothetical protein